MDSIRSSYTMVGSLHYNSLLPKLIAVSLVFVITACREAPAGLNTLTPSQSSAVSNEESRSTASPTPTPSPSQTPLLISETTASPQVIGPGNAGQAADGSQGAFWTGSTPGIYPGRNQPGFWFTGWDNSPLGNPKPTLALNTNWVGPGFPKANINDTSSGERLITA